jgi:DNA polymerase-3 subunit delta
MYVLVGTESYLLNDCALQIKQAFKQQGDYDTKVIDLELAADWNELFAEANSYSLFHDNVFLDARFPKKTVDAKAKELLTDYLKDVNDRCAILLRLPLATAKSLTWLYNHPNVVLVQIYPLNAMAQKQWTEARCKTYHLNISPTVPSCILRYTEGNLTATSQLIEKLAIAYKENELITEAMVEEHAADSCLYDIYGHADACLHATCNIALKLVQQSRAEDVEPTLLLWIITQEIRRLIKLIELTQHQHIPFAKACEQLFIWSTKTALYNKAMQRYSLPSLYHLLQRCKQMDEAIKTSQTDLFWSQMDTTVLHLCGITQ